MCGVDVPGQLVVHDEQVPNAHALRVWNHVYTGAAAQMQVRVPHHLTQADDVLPVRVSFRVAGREIQRFCQIHPLAVSRSSGHKLRAGIILESVPQNRMPTMMRRAMERPKCAVLVFQLVETFGVVDRCPKRVVLST